MPAGIFFAWTRLLAAFLFTECLAQGLGFVACLVLRAVYANAVCLAMAVAIMRAGKYIAVDMERMIWHVMPHSVCCRRAFGLKGSAAGLGTALRVRTCDLYIGTAAPALRVACAGSHITF